MIILHFAFRYTIIILLIIILRIFDDVANTSALSPNKPAKKSSPNSKKSYR